MQMKTTVKPIFVEVIHKIVWLLDFFESYVWVRKSVKNLKVLSEIKSPFLRLETDVKTK